MNCVLFAKMDQVFSLKKRNTGRVPTPTGEPGKMGRHFPVREKSGNFEQTGKVRVKPHKILEN